MPSSAKPKRNLKSKSAASPTTNKLPQATPTTSNGLPVRSSSNASLSKTTPSPTAASAPASSAPPNKSPSACINLKKPAPTSSSSNSAPNSKKWNALPLPSLPANHSQLRLPKQN